MDTIIYAKNTRKVIAILTDVDIRGKDCIALNNIEIETVDCSQNNLIADEITGEVKFRNSKSNIIYFEDYVRRNK